jgi:hypothetical protein
LLERKDGKTQDKKQKATQKALSPDITTTANIPTQHLGWCKKKKKFRNKPNEPKAFIAALKDGLHYIKQTLFDQSAAKQKNSAEEDQ